MTNVSAASTSQSLAYKRGAVSAEKTETQAVPTASPSKATVAAAAALTLSADSIFAVIDAKNNSDASFAQSRYDERFFPVRDGFTSNALATAVSDPSAVSSSAGKTLDVVATDARALMNQNYEKMDASGQPFNSSSFEGTDWYSLMGSLDRRSLFAVASNQGNLFTKEESTIARTFMDQQLGLAMGLYAGPTSQKGFFSDPYTSDPSKRFEAGQAFLSQVSSDEKASGQWHLDMLAAETNGRRTKKLDDEASNRTSNPTTTAKKREDEEDMIKITADPLHTKYLTAEFDFATGEYSYFINI